MLKAITHGTIFDLFTVSILHPGQGEMPPHVPKLSSTSYNSTDFHASQIY
ncbi:hypothetical protein RchiOBHm_Chr1g0318021 [Rosa chinensis]|uniref:Uncharacterized protein n=1 Tax=Rosa chinensis TaxID=74649 RepID=A0A2P6S811_ROSCH|nr:hypothetical protein RchiOBHm_Chr1g0318021 [Rosa chinensis]